MVDHRAAIGRESMRLLEVARHAEGGSPVPSCPGWTIADLVWHVSEVQHFWASIVDGLLAQPEEVPELTRPPDSGLADLFAGKTRALLEALARRSPADECWSWHAGGAHVGWVSRRQAHEALIHRVDGELAAAGQPSEVDTDLAVDGVDEVLTVMMDATDLPAWSRFDPSGVTARLEAGDRHWSMELGDFRGSSPNSGTIYDEPAIRLVPVDRPSAHLRGTPVDLDLWLWGRGRLERIQVDGDPTVAATIRAAAVAATQ